MAAHAQDPSAPLPVPKVCIERQTPTGPIFVPVVPVDQLPYQLEGLSSRIGHRQVIKEDWHLLDEVMEAAPVFPVHPASSVAPKFRAPDHNVMSDAAVQTTKTSTSPERPATFTCPSTKIEPLKTEEEHRNCKNEGCDRTEPVPINSCTEARPTDLPGNGTSDVKHADAPTGHHESPLSIDRKLLSVTHVDDNNTSQRDAGYTHEKANTGRSMAVRCAGDGMMPFSRLDPQLPASSDVEGASKDHKLELHGLRTIREQQPRRKKIYCTYWIHKNECLYPDCMYKHEMPPLNILMQETQLTRYPQWWKDKQATRPQGPTWMETRVQAQGNQYGRSDAPQMPVPRQFPDPSIWRSWRPNSPAAVVDHDYSAKKVTPEVKVTPKVTPTPLLIDVDPPAVLATAPILPVSASAAAPALTASLDLKNASMEKEKKGSPTVVCRPSQISWSTGTSDNTQPAKQPKKKAKKQSKEGQQNTVQQPKKPGITASKCAPAENEKSTANRRQAELPAYQEDLLI